MEVTYKSFLKKKESLVVYAYDFDYGGIARYVISVDINEPEGSIWYHNDWSEDYSSIKEFFDIHRRRKIKIFDDIVEAAENVKSKY